MDHTKIFIDTDNEITFILEKILSAKSERVSLIIPDRASILSSITGLKVIKRVVDKSNKLLIVVTLDDLGAELVKKAGLHVVERIGEIDEEAWQKVQKEKFEVIKKGIKSHYVPDHVEDKLSLADIAEKKESVKDSVSVVDLLNEIEDEGVEEAHEQIDVNEIAVPQVRINIDLQDKNDDVVEPEVTPEPLHTTSSLDEVEIEEEEDIKPKFLSREHIKSAYQARHQEEPEAEIQEAVVHEDDTHRIRKRVSNTPSKISNLSFSIGKDITEKKK